MRLGQIAVEERRLEVQVRRVDGSPLEALLRPLLDVGRMRQLLVAEFRVGPFGIGEFVDSFSCLTFSFSSMGCVGSRAEVRVRPEGDWLGL